MSHIHIIEKCSCGNLIKQCRCFSKDKKLTIIKNGCIKCKKALEEGLDHECWVEVCSCGKILEQCGCFETDYDFIRQNLIKNIKKTTLVNACEICRSSSNICERCGGTVINLGVGQKCENFQNPDSEIDCDFVWLSG